MNPWIRSIIAILIGLVVGASVNMGLILISGKVIAPPPGVDTSTMEGLKAAMPLFEPKHFLFPFLAHALGTLVGALVAALIADRHKMVHALAIGVVFLAGGITMVLSLPSPAWFNALDLGLAYIPVAWLGGRLAMKRS